MLQRKSVHSIQEVFEFLRLEQGRCMRPLDWSVVRREFEGDPINIFSDKLTTFLYKGIICVRCNLPATFFAKERRKAKHPWFLNLYALTSDGKEILMTQDHVIPASRGGRNHVSNLETMCSPCNQIKGDGEFPFFSFGFEPFIDHEAGEYVARGRVKKLT